MSSIIKLKRSLTSGSVPSSLEAGELAINIPDKKLFSSNGSSVFNVSGDQYNLTTSTGSDPTITLTVDNENLSNDAISFAGGTGINVTESGGTITIESDGTVSQADTLSTARDFSITGDVTASAVSFDGSGNVTLSTSLAAGVVDTAELAAGAVTTAKIEDAQITSAKIAASAVTANTVADNAVALGTKTTGNYVAGVTGGTNITVTGSGSEGATPTINLDATISANTTGSAATLTTARNIGGVSFDGSADINLPGVNTAGNQDTSGNAATATALETARTIGGVSFDGTANINLPGVNTTGNQDTSGNAATATTLETARTISIAGDQAGSVSFDGSGDVTITVATQANSVDLGTHTTGNYAAGVTGTTNEIEVTGTAGEGTTFQIGLPNDVTIGNDLSVTGATTVGGNLTVDGNLEVNGTLTYIDSTTVTIGDNMLKLANTNTTDTADLGFYSVFNDGSTKYTGLVRDASDGTYTLFTDLATEPDQTINFANATTATLNAVIDGGSY